MKRQISGFCMIALVGVAGLAQAAPVTSADEVCPADADPCNVTTVVSVADDATLDFYNRTINVSGNGRFEFGGGIGTILCGSFDASGTGDAIVAVGPGETDGGAVAIIARRLCTGGSPQRPCVDLEDCQLGTCTVRHCSIDSDFTCESDAGCDLRPCSAGHCFSSVRQCDTNAECDLGPCQEQLTCSGSRLTPQNCSNNADCELGTCTVGEASISIAAGIYGRAQSPADVDLAAADSVSVTGPVELSGRSADSDGGDFFVQAEEGSITLAGRVRARSGRLGAGGWTNLDAGQDVTISAPIDVAGGDFDGGFITVHAGRDIRVTSNLFAHSRGGGGVGGEIELDADHDLAVGGGSRRIRLNVSGHKSRDNFSGDGGDFFFEAGHDAVFAENTRLLAFGSTHDGYAGAAFFETDGELQFAGQLLARARSPKGGGGLYAVSSDGAVSIADTAMIDVRGGDSRAGEVVIDSSAATVTIGGRVLVSGAGDGVNDGMIDIEACRVALSGQLVNKSSAARSSIVAHESMRLLADSEMSTSGGVNVLTYRTSAKPPIVEGEIAPAPQLQLDESLTGCPVCGNAEIDFGETCDDGNIASGDGCSSECTLE